MVYFIQPRFYKGAVVALKGHKVGDRSKRYQVAVFINNLFGLIFAYGAGDQKRHPYARIFLKINIVHQKRVNYRYAIGKRLLRAVVVGNNNVNADFFGKGNFLNRRNAVVNRNNKRHARRFKLAYGVGVKTVPLAKTRGQIGGNVRAHIFKKLAKQSSSGYAVAVVIAVNTNLFAACCGSKYALFGGKHFGAVGKRA